MYLFDRFFKPKKLELRLEQSQEPEPEPDEIRHYLASTRHVVPGLEPFEINLGGPSYVTVPALVSGDALKKHMTRWKVSPEARAAVAAGADIYLELLTFGRAMQPILISVSGELDKDAIAEEYGITPPKKSEEKP